jgi:hypothetical protein
MPMTFSRCSTQPSQPQPQETQPASRKGAAQVAPYFSFLLSLLGGGSGPGTRNHSAHPSAGLPGDGQQGAAMLVILWCGSDSKRVYNDLVWNGDEIVADGQLSPADTVICGWTTLLLRVASFDSSTRNLALAISQSQPRRYLVRFRMEHTCALPTPACLPIPCFCSAPGLIRTLETR